MGLSPTEIIVIVLVALLIFGPGRIAGVGRGLGDGIRSFKDGLRGIADDEPATAKTAAPAKQVPLADGAPPVTQPAKAAEPARRG
jgi:sec-independent protein translocase protein TatA